MPFASKDSNSGAGASTPAGSSGSPTPTAVAAPVPVDPVQQVVSTIRYNIALLDRGVQSKESRYTSRVLRTIVTLRKKLRKQVLKNVIEQYLPITSDTKAELFKALENAVDAFPPLTSDIVPEISTTAVNGNLNGDAMVVDEISAPSTTAASSAASASTSSTSSTPTALTDSTSSVSNGSTSTSTTKKPTGPPSSVNPEIDVFVSLLTVIYLIDNKDYSSARSLSLSLTNRVQRYNRRTLDLLAAKSYFYFLRAHELSGEASDIRPIFHTALRTATLHRDYEGQATLINLLLRNYIQHNLYDQADKLAAKSTFPEVASNNELSRYLYYMGRIRAVQLEYSESFDNLQQALRKAPQTTAIGFQQTVQKLSIIVQMLLGEIPDRAVFRQKALSDSLIPYFQLTQAVRVGDLSRFSTVLEKFGAKFRADKNYTLILRLRHSVIKTGVRMINLSYSRISMEDIAKKLQLESAMDAQYIVAKAIADGVIDATIDYENGWMQSKDVVDIYSSTEPLNAFDQRIMFCLNIHNDSVKALRFPPNAHRKHLETPEERREREQQELEFAEEMANEED